MIEATPHPNEKERLVALKRLNILDTPIEERFERITRMVCRLLDMPVSIFNLIDEDRQHYKSVQGLNNVDASIEAAFCTHAINEPDMLLVPDAHQDQRFHDNPFVTGEYLNIGFYAGCPVRTPSGMPIGTLCAIDMKPRALTHEQLTTLRDLAAMVETELKVASLSRSHAGLVEELNSAQRLAMIDSLTRLWNRSGILNLLEREWAEAVRQNKPVTVVMADIDHFKKFNDTYGHAGGDSVLKTVARKLLECLRGEDAVGRIGGEEFLILLTDCAADKAAETVERIRSFIEQESFMMGNEPCQVTMSFGVATEIPDSGSYYNDLIERADKALYSAKNHGRNCVKIAA